MTFSYREMDDQLIHAVRLFASEFTPAANSFGGFANANFRWLFVVAAHLHLTEDTFALHFLFKRAQGLIDIVVSNNNLYQTRLPPFGCL